LCTSAGFGLGLFACVLSAFIGVHRRPIFGFDFRVGPEEKHIRPPMNADEPIRPVLGVLRLVGSYGVRDSHFSFRAAVRGIARRPDIRG
jgi:hypothetical protein